MHQLIRQGMIRPEEASGKMEASQIWHRQEQGRVGPLQEIGLWLAWEQNIQ